MLSAVAGELFNGPPGAYWTAEEAEDYVAHLALMTPATVYLQKATVSLGLGR